MVCSRANFTFYACSVSAFTVFHAHCVQVCCIGCDPSHWHLMEERPLSMFLFGNHIYLTFCHEYKLIFVGFVLCVRSCMVAATECS